MARSAPGQAPPALGPACAPHENLNAVLWVQTALEYEALARQAYAVAGASLERALADPSWSAAPEQQGNVIAGLPPAVILDLDETVLDNSAFQARLMTGGEEYSEATWRDWVEERAARAIPGAAEFLRAADARGVTIFYVTNREAVSEPATRDNVVRLGLPLDAARDSVLTRGERPEWAGSDKSTRRAEVARDFRVLLLVGDDLGDFLPNARGSVEERAQRAAPWTSWWGTRWIVLPNPTYGSWEAAAGRAPAGAPASAPGKCGRLRTR